MPNLQGNVPLGQGAGPGLTPTKITELKGSTTVSIVSAQMPAHSHLAKGTSVTTGVQDPTNSIWASETPSYPFKPYTTTPNVAMNPQALQFVGGSQPHNNMQPYLVLNYIIAINGFYPPKP